MNQRMEFALKALQTDNFRALCREYGISTKVGYKWRGRFVAEGVAGLRDLSRRPKGSPSALSEEEICRIVRLKERHRHWGPRKLHELYLRQWGVGPSESSFKRVLERCGLTEKRRLRAAATAGRIASGRRASAPNEVWTVDFKGWWYDAQGKCNPLTVRDEYSRYLLEMRALADARTVTVQSCFERLFGEYGVPGAIRSDNGSPFGSHGLLGLSRLSAWWIANGIDLERSRPGCPQDNGVVLPRKNGRVGRSGLFVSLGMGGGCGSNFAGRRGGFESRGIRGVFCGCKMFPSSRRPRWRRRFWKARVRRLRATRP